MKKVLLVLPIVAAIAACSSTGSSYDKRADAARERNYEVQKQTVSKAPDWFTNPPKSTENVVYVTGTYASTNWALADRTATDIALGKLCVKLGGQVNQQSKVYQRDIDGNTQEFSETTIKNICNKIDVTGYVVDSKDQFTDKNGRIRSYILIAYPIGDANPLKAAKDRERQQGNTLQNANRAFDELDRNTGNVQQEPTQQQGQPQSQTNAVPIDQLGLVEVENEAYKKKRSEALQKPGAVYGRMTVPM